MVVYTLVDNRPHTNHRRNSSHSGALNVVDIGRLMDIWWFIQLLMKQTIDSAILRGRGEGCVCAINWFSGV